jgi:hypothetical protein
LWLFAESRPCDEYATQQNCDPRIKSFNLPPCLGHHSHNESAVVFGVIGDYGIRYADCEGHVANLVEQFDRVFGPLDFIMTAGDNNYWDGNCVNMHNNIGFYYDKYFNPGASCINPKMNVNQTKVNRFYPSIGNHDWDTFKTTTNEKLPYLQYFEYLKSFEPYFARGVFYKKTIANGLIELYSLNSNLGAPHASEAEKSLNKKQMDWAEKSLKESNATFKIVYFHHPAHTTAKIDPPATWMLPYNFSEWGASLVINGHEHVYERLSIDGIYNVICGLGGHPWLYTIHDCDIEQGSIVRYNDYHGAMVAFANKTNIDFCFYSIEGNSKIIDSFSIKSRPRG